jgi:hypothetical protein
LSEYKLEKDKAPVTVMAMALTAAGALPFIFGAALAVFGTDLGRGLQGEAIIIAYGAVILSFLGGIRWGAGLQRGFGTTLMFSVLPSLAGFAALLVPATPALILLAVGFVLQALWDFRSSGDLPQWFIRQRMAVSAVVIICIVTALIA